jgi:HD-like signal output (HDOD) protein
MGETMTEGTMGERVRLAALLRAIDELPTIPETLIKILRILDDPQSSAQALADVVRLDAPLTAKILRLANSPYYCAAGNLADVRSCIGVLGFKTVRQLAICVSIATSLVAECNRRRSRLDYRELWKHSVNVAVVAKELALLTRTKDPEEIFTAGLLHDLGKFVILLHAPATYDQVISQRRAAARPLCEMELELLGYDHTMAGEVFGVSWRFPAVLTRPARKHHDHLLREPQASREDYAVRLVALANELANRISPPESDLGFYREADATEALHAAAGLTLDAVNERLPKIREALANSGAYLELA